MHTTTLIDISLYKCTRRHTHTAHARSSCRKHTHTKNIHVREKKETKQKGEGTGGAAAAAAALRRRDGIKGKGNNEAVVINRCIVYTGSAAACFNYMRIVPSRRPVT